MIDRTKEDQILRNKILAWVQEHSTYFGLAYHAATEE